MSIQRAKHVPLRTCIVCGIKAAKRDLVRIVAPPGGGVEMDRTGKASGRGAYVCRTGACKPGAPRRSRIDYAMRRKMSDADWSELSSSIEALATFR